MARVSICTSVYNQTHFLHGMIASVVGQSYDDWELIIVDDGSEEDVAAEVQYWNDPRISLYRFPQNKGVPHGSAHAFSLAIGEYVQPLSADERLDLNKLLWQVGYLDEHPEIGGIWGLPQNGPLGERPEHEQYLLKAHNRSREAWIRTLLNLDAIPIGGASWLCRKAVLDDIGYWDPQFIKCADLELFIRFFKKYEGRVFPYRWAWEDEEARAIPKPNTAEAFNKEMSAVLAKHPLYAPPTEGRVTVAIPVRNMAKYIPDTMKSLYAQTFQDFDIMILDDESTDDTLETMQICALEYPMPERTKFIQIKENIGPIAAQNHMLSQASDNGFFVVLAADDTLEPTFLEKCLGAFKENPWLEFVGTQTDFIQKDGTPYTEDHPFKNIMKASNKSRDVWLNQLYYGNQYFGSGMYRTKALKHVGGWDPTVGVVADYDVYLKMLMRGDICVIEENLTHTRIHDENRSILKTKKEQLELRKHYSKIRSRYYQPRMKVIIATPFYNMQGFSPYIMSIVNTVDLLTLSGIQHEFWELSGDSYVDRAKNTLLNKFLEDPDATDIFMIDSDMQWDPRSFLEMLQLPEEIVMGSYPQKNAWESWTAMPVTKEIEGKHHPIGRMLANGSALIQANWLAGGYIRIKRSALEKYKEEYKELTYYDPGADPAYADREYIEFFTCERAKNDQGMPLRWGEDRVFGKRMKAIGVDAWIYPKIDFGHYGIKGWMGNYDTHLKAARAAT